MADSASPERISIDNEHSLKCPAGPELEKIAEGHLAEEQMTREKILSPQP